MLTATKLQSDWNDRAAQRKSGQCPSRMLLIRLLKRSFKDLCFNPISKWWQETILKNLKHQFMSVIKLKPKLCTKDIELCIKFERRDGERQTIILPSQNLNCWVQLHEVIRVCQYARTNLKPQNFTWITIFTLEFFQVISVANTFSS